MTMPADSAETPLGAPIPLLESLVDRREKRLAALGFAALGVVYGDIGTSPLYAFKEAFSHGLAATAPNVLGVLSMILWSLAAVVLVKYGMFILRADNHGEGGAMALIALLSQNMRTRPRARRLLIFAGLLGAALFYGDGVLTPAISVLSAMEGIGVASPGLSRLVAPLAGLVIIALFMIQKKGTRAVGAAFAPCMTLWFVAIGALGAINVARHPAVFECFNPVWAWRFFEAHGAAGFGILGAVFLALTGAEALYADMGHFGRRPIVFAWVAVAMPALYLNYMGQGALLLVDPSAARNPFFLMAPGWALWPLIALSTCAAVIASQAVISGAFSVTKAAVALGYLPRMEIRHTNSQMMGQIFIPSVNRALMMGVLALVLLFQTSQSLSAAYGLAVNGTMIVTSVLAAAVFRYRFGWTRPKAFAFLAVFATLDAVFLAANALKFFEGGWMPLALAIVLFFLMTTWKRGRELLRERMGKSGLSVSDLIDMLKLDMPHRPVGAAVFMHSSDEGSPPAMLHNLHHNQVLHETAIILTVHTAENPYVAGANKLSLTDLGEGIWRAHLTFGFREAPDVPKALRRAAARKKLPFDPAMASYFLSRESLAATPGGMPVWRDKVFIAMSKNASTASSHFHIPPNQVVELGACVEI